jgi:CelD/BcsL family acetyltransferase involved in cellulose biosynthesis
MTRITLAAVDDWEAVGARWRELEAIADCSFFQSWTWVGCQVAQRFSDALLLEARDGDRTLALALLNRRRGGLFGTRRWLQETGEPSFDDVFTEHNGVLVARGHEALRTACLRAARGGFAGTLVVSGVGDAELAAARASGGAVVVRQTRPAPFVDLAALRQRGGDYLGSLHPNARYQLRRSARRYGEAGPLRAVRAETLETALGFLAELMALHQATWLRRGRPGAFANPRFTAFHQALIDRGLPRGEIDLWQVSAGAQVAGYLYNFRHRNVASSYQSGFDYVAADTHQKPGLTCHHLAIEACLALGVERYDFLAGDDRYKRSLASDVATLNWLEIVPPGSPAAMRDRLRRWIRPAQSEGTPEVRTSPRPAPAASGRDVA